MQLLDLLADIDAAPSNDDLTFAISRLLLYMCLDDRIHGNFGGDVNVPKMLADKVQVYIESKPILGFENSTSHSGSAGPGRYYVQLQYGLEFDVHGFIGAASRPVRAWLQDGS